MFIDVEDASFDEQTGNLVLFAPGVASTIEKYKNLSQFIGFDLRFAAARRGTTAYIVIGLRYEGRGFDLAIGSKYWSELAAGPTELLLYYGKSRRDDLNLTFAWPDESFQTFIDECGNMSQDDPSRTYVAEIASYFDSAVR